MTDIGTAPGIRTAICDDSDAMRQALASFLRPDPGIQLVGSYSGGAEAVRRAPADDVQVLLLDVRMPGMDGPSVARQLTGSGIKVVYLTSYPEVVQVEDALAGVVMGALTKDLPPEDLARAVHFAARGLTTLAPSVRGNYRPPAPRVPRTDVARDATEADVLALLCQGHSNEQIANALHRSVSSVKQALTRMSQRAGVHTRVELVLYALDGSPATRRRL